MTVRPLLACSCLLSLSLLLPACKEGPTGYGDRDFGPASNHHPVTDSAARPVQWPTRPPPKVEAPPVPTPSPAEDAATDALSEEKAALADVGSAAFDALRSGDFEGLLALTHFDDGTLAKDCPDMPGNGNKREVEARFDHCHDEIPWEKVVDAQIFAGTPSGDPAPGCAKGLEDYGRLQLYLHMEDKTIWRVDFLGAVGRGGQAIGVDGAISCRTVDEAPKLR